MRPTVATVNGVYPNNPVKTEFQQAAEPAAEQRNHAGFLGSLFRKLDQHGVRYCVLHSWELLPEMITSDLDIGVHPQDQPKLAIALADVERDGYLLVQNLNYF